MQILSRTNSLRNFDEKRQRCDVQAADKQTQLKDNIIRLKSEELTFKLKSKFAMTLRYINISSGQLSKFTSLGSIDEILDFMNRKIKDLISSKFKDDEGTKSV